MSQQWQTYFLLPALCQLLLVCCDQEAGQSVYFGFQRRVQWQGRQDGRSLAHGPGQEVEEGNISVYLEFSFLCCCIVPDSSQWNGIPHLQGGFLHLADPLWKSYRHTQWSALLTPSVFLIPTKFIIKMNHYSTRIRDCKYQYCNFNFLSIFIHLIPLLFLWTPNMFI